MKTAKKVQARTKYIQLYSPYSLVFHFLCFPLKIHQKLLSTQLN